MRNHYLLHIALRGGEEGEYELIGASNSAFPSLWAVLFGESEQADEALRRAFGRNARHLLSTDANSAAARLAAVSDFLCDTLGTHAQLECSRNFVADLQRYLRGVVEHLRGLIAAWTFSETPPATILVSFDEASPPNGMSKEVFVDDSMQSFSTQWHDIQRAIASCDVADVCAHLGVDHADMTKWRPWAEKVGLALFQHEYFYGAFRQPRQMDYADFDYDPLGSDIDLGEGRMRFKRHGRWGVALCRSDERFELLAPEWDRILRAETGTCGLVWLRRDDRLGLATIAQGACILREPTFDAVWPFHDGAALVRVGDKMGYLKDDGNWLLEPQWDEAWEFANGFAVVSCDDKLTYIDRAGCMLVPPTFDAAEPFTEFGIARVRCNDRYGVLRSDGTFALHTEYSKIEWLRGRFIGAYIKERVALFDCQGSLLFECVGENIRALKVERPRFIVSDRGSAKLLDESGEAMLPDMYLDVGEFDRDCFDCVRVTRKHPGRPKHGVWSLAENREIVPCSYEIIWPVLLDGPELGFFVATKTHVSTDARGLTYSVGVLRSDGSTFIPECYAWIGDPISLGRANARDRVRSAIEFAISSGRPLEAARWEDGVVERVALREEGPQSSVFSLQPERSSYVAEQSG